MIQEEEITVEGSSTWKHRLHVKSVIPLNFAIELVVAAYFAVSLTYYVSFLPMGHIVNLVFSILFLLLILLQKHRLAVPTEYMAPVCWSLLIATMSVLGWLVRSGGMIGDVVRSATWITPALLAILLCQARSLNWSRIGAFVAVVSVAANISMTLTFAQFDRELGKFVVDASWTWISSNELSFHLAAFGALFLFTCNARQSRNAGLAIALLSMVHLSKAHLVGTTAGVLTFLAGRKVLRITLVVVAMGGLIWWLGSGELLAEVEVVGEFSRVFNPIVATASLAIDLLVTGTMSDLAAWSDAVGLYRFEVYLDSFVLIASSPFGLPSDIVSGALQGLDPHSNALYLALREGWFVSVAYWAALIHMFLKLPSISTKEKLIYGALVYVVFRSLFLTFDPVKLFCLMVYCFAAVQPGTGWIPERSVAEVVPGRVSVS